MGSIGLMHARLHVRRRKFWGRDAEMADTALIWGGWMTYSKHLRRGFGPLLERGEARRRLAEALRQHFEALRDLAEAPRQHLKARREGFEAPRGLPQHFADLPKHSGNISKRFAGLPKHCADSPKHFRDPPKHLGNAPRHSGNSTEHTFALSEAPAALQTALFGGLTRPLMREKDLPPPATRRRRARGRLGAAGSRG